MRFCNELMVDPEVQKKKIGEDLKRSDRNLWAESIEELVRSRCPYPASYDVSSTSSINFSEFTYTEIAGGFWINTQSLEINARIMELASTIETDKEKVLKEFNKIISDKYILNTKTPKNIKRICFLPGHNMLDVASIEMIARIAHEEDDVMFKLHPLTDEHAISLIAKRVGWHKIIDRNMSGFELLKNCDIVYTSTASEMAITGTLLGKKVINISNFFNEGSGAYHTISRILFKAHKESIELAQQKLANMIDCKFSGLLFPWENDIEQRLNAFFNKALEFKEIFKPIASPQGNFNDRKPKDKNEGK